MQFVVRVTGRKACFKTQFGPVPMDFRVIRNSNGESVVLAHVPEDEELRQHVLAQVQLSAGRFVILDQRPTLLAGTEWPDFGLAPTSIAAAPSRLEKASTRLEQVHPLVHQARERGWLEDELDGCDPVNPGRDGGLSPITGLALVEMSLSEPPPEWSAVRDTHWPWQVEGWVEVGPAWEPDPRCTDKDGYEGALGMRPEADADVILREASGKFTDDPSKDADGKPEPGRHADPGDAALLDAYGDAALVALAVKVLTKKWTADGACPGNGKAGYALKRAGLAQTRGHKMAALLRLTKSLSPELPGQAPNAVN